MSSIAKQLQTFNQSRDPELLQMKYKAMREDPFAFYRGTCHLFYEDWPADAVLNAAPKAWICGDLHWQNFGCYKGDNRLVYFNINDFDESVLAPCTWDLARILVSLRVGAYALAMKKTQADSIDFFRNKEGSYQAQQSRRRFWLVLVADSHANPQVMQSHGDHGQGITHSGPRIAQNISDTAVSLEPSIAVFNADPS